MQNFLTNVDGYFSFRVKGSQISFNDLIVFTVICRFDLHVILVVIFHDVYCIKKNGLILLQNVLVKEEDFGRNEEMLEILKED